MAYYLKKTTLKGRTYLSIDESFYSNEKKGTAHKCFKSLGSIETLKANGMEDPVAFYKAEVERMNSEHRESKVMEISLSPERYLGHFLLDAVLRKLNVKKSIDFYKYVTTFKFDLFTVFSALIYSRVLKPCSKYRTYTEVIPHLLGEFNFSYDQLMDGLSFFGNNYEQMVELFFTTTNECFKINTDKTYFDCTNFYFEIDKEDLWRRKGPSKENRHDPIIGMGLLLDSNQIPIGMKLYPGNQSEKPVLRTIINDLKERQKITGKTIQVADKGLNCSDNIYAAIKENDGYIFSKSVKNLPEIEKQWILKENDKWTEVKDSSGKLLYKYKSVTDIFDYEINDGAKKRKISIDEKRVITFNPSLRDKQEYELNKLVEKARSLVASKAKKIEFGESSRYVNFEAADKDGVIDDESRIVVEINEKKVKNDRALLGYNMLVTSELNMPETEIYNVYHNLWRIEESFRIMKSDLDARPVYCQTIEAIQGHFLVCYISVLLERILEFKVFDNEFNASELIRFMKSFKVAKIDKGYLNLTSMSDEIRRIADKTGLPLTHYQLTETEIKRILNYKI